MMAYACADENRVISPESDLGPRTLFNERLWDVVWATQWRKTPLLCPKCLETPPATSLVGPLIRADCTSSFTWGDQDQNLGRKPHQLQPLSPTSIRRTMCSSAVPWSPPGASHGPVKGEKKSSTRSLKPGEILGRKTDRDTVKRWHTSNMK